MTPDVWSFLVCILETTVAMHAQLSGECAQTRTSRVGALLSSRFCLLRTFPRFLATVVIGISVADQTEAWVCVGWWS